MRGVSQSREESLDQIQLIGHKATKYLPFQYKISPLCGTDECSYAKQFYPKPSDYMNNKDLAKSFRPSTVPAPVALMETTSHSRQNFMKPSREQRATATMAPFTVDKKGNTGITGGASLTLTSTSHGLHGAPPRQPRTGIILPSQNLAVSGLDGGDCYRTTQRSDFMGKQLSRSRTAPAPMREKSAEALATLGPEICMTRRNIFSSPGK